MVYVLDEMICRIRIPGGMRGVLRNPEGWHPERSISTLRRRTGEQHRTSRRARIGDREGVFGRYKDRYAVHFSRAQRHPPVKGPHQLCEREAA